MTEVRHLRVVDSVTGETFDTCPACLQYEKDLRQMKAKLTRLETDQERKARQHKLWDEARGLFDWWRLATGHFDVAFEAEEFNQVRPRLVKRDGHLKVLKAIAGAAYDPNSRTLKNGSLERYDDWELINRSDTKQRSFHRRVPGGEDDDTTWRIWLVQRIESNLGGRDGDL